MDQWMVWAWVFLQRRLSYSTHGVSGGISLNLRSNKGGGINFVGCKMLQVCSHENYVPFRSQCMSTWFHHPKDHWTLLWRVLTLHSRGLDPQNLHL